MLFFDDLFMQQSLVKYYKARFQIEYLYRDAKQFTGLQHGQSRSLSKMNNHFNISLTSVSIGKVLLRDQIPKDEKSVCQ